MTVDVVKSVDDDNTVRLSFTVTDSSDAPATELLVFLKVHDYSRHSNVTDS